MPETEHEDSSRHASGDRTRSPASRSSIKPSVQRTPTRSGPARGFLSSWNADLAVMAVLAVLAAGVAWGVPDGSRFRLAFTLPVLLVAPGYLLMQVFIVPAAGVTGRFVHGVLSLGVSPAVVGLLALATALFPGGFGSTQIVVVVTLWCLVMAGVALFRRMSRLSTQPVAAVPQGVED